MGGRGRWGRGEWWGEMETTVLEQQEKNKNHYNNLKNLKNIISNTMHWEFLITL